MKKHLSTILATLVVASAPAIAAPVNLGIDAAADGIAGSLQGLIPNGVVEIGWLQPGTTQAQIQSLFLASNFLGIDALFVQVATFGFPSGSLDFDSGGGQYFENVELVPDANPTALSAYKNPLTGAAGKDMFSWVRNSASVAGTTEMAFVDGVGVFPTANDTLNFTDFTGSFAHSIPPVGTTAWVGSITAVVVGGQIDNLGAGNIAGDGFGATGSSFVLQLAAVPEPSTGLLLLVGLAGVAARRRRNA